MRKFFSFFSALLFLGLSCGCTAKPTKSDLQKPVIDSSPSSSKLGDLLTLTARSYEAKALSYLPTLVKTSSNGRFVAIFDGGATRLFNSAGEQISQIKDVRPLTWSKTADLLYVVDRHGQFFTIAPSGAIDSQSWLTAFFQGYYTGTDFSDPNAYSAGNGLIAMQGRQRQNVLVANVDSKFHFTANVGLKWTTRRPASSVQIGWDATKNEPALFISEQLASGGRSDQIEIVNRLEVYGQDGKSIFFTENGGDELSYLPVITSVGAHLLSRVGEFRCLYTTDGSGKTTKQGPCNADLEFVSLDQSGQPIVYSKFIKHDNLPGQDYAAALGSYSNTTPIALLHDSRVLIWATRGNRLPSELVLLKDHAILETHLIDSEGTSQRSVETLGKALEGQSKDGFQVHGYLFSPSNNTKLRGIVMLLHGGPYAAETDVLDAPLGQNFLKRGFAVVSVNYRGTPGYGRKYLEKGFGGAFDEMLDDVEALRSSAIAELGITDQIPTVLYGRSFGGFLAINAMRKHYLPKSNYVLDAAVCDFSMTKDNVMLDPAKKGGINSVYDPAKAAYNLKLATSADGKPLNLNLCDVHVPAEGRMVVLHSKDDRIAPYVPMAAFAKAQPINQLALISFEQNGHNPTLSLQTASEAQFEVMSNYVLDFVLDAKTPQSGTNVTNTKNVNAH